ncbi:MAG: hypothetical protein RL577_62 [Bacteroidota bacterium]
MFRNQVFGIITLVFVLVSCRNDQSETPAYEPAQRLAEFSSVLVRSHNALEALSMGEEFWPAAATRRWMDSVANDLDGWALQVDFGPGMQWADGSWVRGTLSLSGMNWPIAKGDSLSINWSSSDSFAIKASKNWVSLIGAVQFQAEAFGRSRLRWLGEFQQGQQKVHASAITQWELVPENSLEPTWKDAHWLSAQVELAYVQWASGQPVQWNAEVFKAERAKHCLEQVLAGRWTASPLLQNQDSTYIDHDPFRDRRCDATVRVESGKQEWLLDAW